jgi:hypothetical protein
MSTAKDNHMSKKKKKKKKNGGESEFFKIRNWKLRKAV